MADPVEGLDRLERLFRAAQLHPPEERSAFLSAACADDPALRGELVSLLAADEGARAAAFLEAPPDAGALPTGVPRAGAPCADGCADAYWDEGARVGPYTLQRRLGHGGMGDVFLARRDAPFRRYVALKVIRRGMDTQAVLARFEMERQILAALDHPNIARLLDGGVTAGGRPYFAMEYVEGLPIDAYCDQHRLTVDARLRLFQQVCRAVHYAHQNLVVHRDLKPSNILVARGGVPKLLDFGVAKLLNPNLGPSAPPVTRSGGPPMTPEYASPEQVRGEGLTTASDVYALGVILYELLTGRTPYVLPSRTAEALVRAVREQDPERPSTRVARTEAGARSRDPSVPLTPEAVAAARACSPVALRRRLRGDLDRIVLKALRKEVPGRYGSAEQFSQDLGRYLAGRPVEARPSTMRYQVARFVGRHRTGVAAALLVLLALVGGLGAAVWQADAARRERDRAQAEALKAERARVQAEAVTTFLMDLFAANDPAESHGEELTARELLARGQARAQALAGQPDVQAQMLRVIGRVYVSLGRYDQAQPLLERALAQRRAGADGDDARVAQSLADLGFLSYLQGAYEAAARDLRDALAMRRRLAAADPAGTAPHLDLAESLTLSAALAYRQVDYAAAEAFYREALALRRTHLGPEHPDVATSLNNLALVLRLRGDPAGAEALLVEALDQWRRFLGPEHPYVAAGLNSLGRVRFAQGDTGGAEQHHRQALALRRRLLGDDHPDVARTMTHLAVVLDAQGRSDEAEALYRGSLAIQQAALGAHPDLAQSQHGLADLLYAQGRHGEAEGFYAAALATRRAVSGDAHPEVPSLLHRLAQVVEAQHQPARAAALYEEGLAARRAVMGPRHVSVAHDLTALAAVRRTQGAFPEAEACYAEALELLADARDEAAVAAVHDGLAALYDAWGRPADADRYRARHRPAAAAVAAAPATDEY